LSSKAYNSEQNQIHKGKKSIKCYGIPWIFQAFKPPQQPLWPWASSLLATATQTTPQMLSSSPRWQVLWVGPFNL